MREVNQIANTANFLNPAREDVGPNRLAVPQAGYGWPMDGTVSATEQDLSDYRNNVRCILDDVIAGNTPARTFDNYSNAYAGIVVREMLSRARKSVHCFSEQLSNEVYNLDYMKSVLARSGEATIKLVVEEPDILINPQSALFGAAEFLKDKRVEVRVYNPPFNVEHVLIVDDRMARIETERSYRKASVQVAKETSRFVQGASALFAQVYRLSTPLPS